MFIGCSDKPRLSLNGYRRSGTGAGLVCEMESGGVGDSGAVVGSKGTVRVRAPCFLMGETGGVGCLTDSLKPMGGASLDLEGFGGW